MTWWMWLIIVAIVIYMIARLNSRNRRQANSYSEYVRSSGLTGTAAAMESATAFDQRRELSYSGTPTPVDTPTLGRLLNDAIDRPVHAMGDASPDQIDEMVPPVIALMSVVPMDHSLLPLHVAATAYGRAAITWIEASGYSTSMTFHARDRRDLAAAQRAAAAAESVASTAQEQLKASFRALWASQPQMFDVLQIDKSNLTWLYLDDIVDEWTAQR